MKKLVLLLLVAMMFVGVSMAQQDKYSRVNIPFNFMVGDKQLPAGTYEVMVTDNTRALQFKSIDNKETATIVVMTRLAAVPGSTAKDRLTFDVLDGKMTLETFWPKNDDGFLIHTTPGKHTHRTVNIG